MIKSFHSPRRAAVRVAVAGGLYAIAIVAINLVDGAVALPPQARIVLSLLPILPTLFLLAALVDRVRMLDEVQQRIVTESALLAAGTVGLVSFAWGLLEGAVSLPDVSFVWVLPALIATYGLATLFIRRRYQ